MNKTGLILVSHGDFAKAALASAEMIAGKQDDVVALALSEDSSLEWLEKELSNCYDSLHSSCSDVIILCDIYGGTPFNAILRLLAKGMQAFAYTGLSLPLLIDLLLARELPHDEIASRIEETSKIACQPIPIPALCEDEDICDL